MIDKDRDAAVGVKAEEPVFLLLIAHDVTGVKDKDQPSAQKSH